jgi:hypothetical protein
MWCSAPIFYCVSRSHQNSNLVWVQIDFNFIKDLEKERRFSIFPSLMGQNQPAHRLGPANHSRGRPVAGHRGSVVCQACTRIAKGIRPDNTESDPIGGYPDPQPESIPVNGFGWNQVYPQPKSSLSSMIWSRLRDRLVRSLSPLRVGVKTPINTKLLSSNFVCKTKNMLNPRWLSNSIIRHLLKQLDWSRGKRRLLGRFSSYS